MRSIRLISILFFLSIFIIITIPIQFFLNIINTNLKNTYPIFFYKIIKFIVGINIEIKGFEKTTQKGSATLYIANHVSWFLVCKNHVKLKLL